MNKKREARLKAWFMVVAFGATFGLVDARARASENLPEVGGSIRTVSGALIDRAPDVEDEVHGITENQLRLTVDGPLGSDELRLQLHVVQYFMFGPASLGAVPANAPQRFRVFRDDEAWLSSADALAFTYLDRANLRFSLGPLDFTLGRQAISFSKALFWSPLDIYRPFAPWVFDRDYWPGVDAFRTSAALGETSGLDIVVVLGRTLFVDAMTGEIAQSSGFADLSFYGSSALARGNVSVGNVDLAVQAGKVYGGYQAGISLAGVVGIVGFHAEAAFVGAQPLESAREDDPATRDADAELVPTHASIVVGVDLTFDNGLSLATEYYVNGAGNSYEFEIGARRLAAGEIVNISEHLLGFTARFEVTPLIHLRGVAIMAFGQCYADSGCNQLSALLSPSFQYSISDESELLAGMFLAIGSRPSGEPNPIPRSEFGAYNHMAYLQWKLYF